MTLMFTNMQVVGLLPAFLSPLDPRSAADQLADNYSHGGGWSPMAGFKLRDEDKPGKAQLLFQPEDPDADPPMNELSRAKLRKETLIFFEGEWLAVVQEDGSFEVTRVD